MEEHKDFYDISWKVPEEEYRADPALSYSSIAKFAREGFKAVSHLGDKIESQALTFGSAVDSIITGGQEEFNSRFFVADFPDIPDSIIQIVKVLFSRYSEEILSLNDLDSKILMDIALEFNYQNNWKPETKAKVICEKGDTYFGLLLMAKDKTILDLNTFKLVQNAVNALKDSPTTNKYFQLDNPWENKKRYYQLKFKFNHNGVDYRSMADLIIVDYDKKIVYPIDLKTSSHVEWEFYKSFKDWRYDIQVLDLLEQRKSVIAPYREMEERTYFKFMVECDEVVGFGQADWDEYNETDKQYKNDVKNDDVKLMEEWRQATELINKQYEEYDDMFTTAIAIA